jgi:hypothetical protein
MARTPQEIFEHHATVLIAGDIEGSSPTTPTTP